MCREGHEIRAIVSSNEDDDGGEDGLGRFLFVREVGNDDSDDDVLETSAAA